MTEDLKTPEQMAEEYAEDLYKNSDYPKEILVYTKKATAAVFLAGYQAAKDQQADTVKVMPEWISVKDRLPPDGVKMLLIVFGDIHYGWIDQSPSDPTEYCLYFSNTYIDKGHHALTHWMPLPEPPKDGKK